MTREGLVLIDFGGWRETSKAEAVRDNDVDAMVEMDERRVRLDSKRRYGDALDREGTQRRAVHRAKCSEEGAQPLGARTAADH